MDAELTKKRFEELAVRADRSGRAQFTRFLDPALEMDARIAAARQNVPVQFFGGWDGAERRICAFGEAVSEDDYPIACIAIGWNPKYASLTHRDLLGAVMSLGLDREATGDICMGAAEGTACLFAHRDVADYICANLESAKNARLKTERTDTAPEMRPPEGDVIRITVQSERLDGVIAAGWRLSRAEAQRLIAAGLIKHNHVEERRGDARVAEGDLISVRGRGRLRVESVEGETRRGRIALKLFKYKS